MGDSINFKDFLISAIPNSRKAAGGKEVVCRCPFPGCTDKSGHMYISSGSDDKPPMYNCFKCGKNGKVDSKFLSLFDIYDAEIVKYLNSKSTTSNSKSTTRIMINKLSYFYVSDNDISHNKLDYINDRLGYDLTFKDLINLKIVLNISDPLLQSNITKYTRANEVMRQLDKYFLGFISADNNYFILRNMVSNGDLLKEIDTRYVNYNISGKDGFSKHYIIPTQIDLNNNDTVKICMAEGCFDILSVYLNDKDRYRKVYCAAVGKSYKPMIKFFLEKFGLINMEFHIYTDNDVDDNYLRYQFNSIINIGIPIIIHRNMYPGEKDFGVHYTKIKDNYYNL